MSEKSNKIYERLKHDYNYVRKLGYEVFGVFLQGSQNYGLDYEGSDIDTKCIILPSAEDVILNKQPVSKTLILEDKSHIDVKDIRLMWQCFKRQNINYFEILFTDYIYVPYEYSGFWYDMLRIREDIAHYDNHAAVNCIVGMILEKNNALCHPYPTLKDKIEKYGYDNKQLHHILRCRDLLDKYIKGISYAKCLMPNNPSYLISVKAKYIYNLNEAKKLAAETVEYARETKKHYLDNTPKIVDSKVAESMDRILVSTLETYWRGDC